MDTNIRLAVGIPSNGTIKMNTMMSVFQMMGSLPYKFDLITFQSCVIHFNREKIADGALKSNATHLLFVDTDMVFQPSVLEKLLKDDKDIIGVKTYLRQSERVSTVASVDENGENPLPESETELFECYGVGTGFMLIKADVLRKMEKPRFMFDFNKDGEVIGEDIWFCRKARQMGYKVWCDPTVEVLHLGDFAYGKRLSV